MTIEYRPHRSGNGDVDVVMTECPFESCKEELPEGGGFADHWPSCSANSESDTDE